MVQVKISNTILDNNSPKKLVRINTLSFFVKCKCKMNQLFEANMSKIETGPFRSKMVHKLTQGDRQKLSFFVVLLFLVRLGSSINDVTIFLLSSIEKYGSSFLCMLPFVPLLRIHHKIIHTTFPQVP